MTDAHLTAPTQTARTAPPAQTAAAAGRTTSEDRLSIASSSSATVPSGGRLTRVGIDLAAGGTLTLAAGGTLTLTG